MIISLRIILKMINISDKPFTVNQNTNLVFKNCLSFNRAVYEIIRKNIFQQDRPHDNMVRRMRSACWYRRLQTQCQNMEYLLLFHGNNGYANAPQCYVNMYVACSLFHVVKFIVHYLQHLSTQSQPMYEFGSVFLYL
jgi:hypothetical protein